MSSIFSGKTIIIFSPQSWSFLFISKHHYARALSKSNKVYFIAAPETGYNIPENWTSPDGNRNLEVLQYGLYIPEFLKYHFRKLYHILVKRKLKQIFKRKGIHPDVCIDFGCYFEFDNLDFLPASKKLFFPVDDNGLLTADKRGADLVVSVSKNIVEKFTKAGEAGYFINHGLADDFEQLALQCLKQQDYVPNRPLRFAFAGNIFSTYMDFEVFETIIAENPGVIFELFGSMNFNADNPQQFKWNAFILAAPNVRIRGMFSPADLAAEYLKMDGFLLCYKPDYINYHAENSHKILEYLSGGKVLVSTYVSIYSDVDFICMSGKDRNPDLPALFKAVTEEISAYNDFELVKARTGYALENTYVKQLDRIEDLLSKTV